jgi:hypothetical protein
VRVKTTSRNPALRFFLLGFALLLVNIWAFLRWFVARNPGRGPHRLDPTRFQFQTFVSMLRRSIDEGDNDLARFLTYLIAALQTVAPSIGPGIVELLQTSSPQPSLVESILTSLPNEIAALPEIPATRPGVAKPGFILVLDDFHVICAFAGGPAGTGCHAARARERVV